MTKSWYRPSLPRFRYKPGFLFVRSTSCQSSQQMHSRHPSGTLPCSIAIRACAVCWNCHVRLPALLALVDSSNAPETQRANPLLSALHSDHRLVEMYQAHSKQYISSLPSKQYKAPPHFGHSSVSLCCRIILCVIRQTLSVSAIMIGVGYSTHSYPQTHRT